MPGLEFQSVSRTHVGCRRSVNEDALLSRPDLGMWAIADGMGGHDAGEIASALVVERLASCEPGPDLTVQIARAGAVLNDANSRLLGLGREGALKRTVGSTVVALLIADRSFACLWAGDSRAYRLSGGALNQLTRDHSLVQDLVEVGELSAAEAATHPNANVITRAVGAAENLVLDVIKGELRPGDAVLLASDGLTRLVAEEELLIAMAAADLELAADHLIETCLARGAPDNVSLLILRDVAG